MVRRTVRVVAIAGAALLLWPLAAELIRDWPAWLLPRSPRDRYVDELRESGAAATETGRMWLATADRALESPETTGPAFARSGTFGGAESAAHAWRFPIRRGRTLSIGVAYGRGRVFIELFDEEGERLASAPEGSSQLVYRIDRDGEAIARVQTEIAAAGPYRLVQRAEALLDFPVPDVTPRAVQSGWGDPRSGDRRHEGIDIFAPLGTPVVAATAGWITPQTTNRLGGNVVWIWSLSPRVALYYAHLDRQAVTPGQRVEAGDVVGYVGNTGNARGTPPHLHFGVYAPAEGAVDPLPFVCDAPCGERVMQQAQRIRRTP